MVTDLHTRAGRETGVQEMLVSRWQKMLEAPFNTALDMIWTSFRAARIGKGHVNGAELSHDEAIQIAKQEWLRAVAYFHEVSEPDLVDYAIYSLHAAERKYMYLLEKARQEYSGV